MLRLVDVKKDYQVGIQKVHALKGINLSFRKSEFVSILGPSGCGKTTLLNLIGGLDTYTSGDMLVDGKSTKTFKDSNWDSYRNKSIGFVFQNYNLIAHLSVLENVEIALSLSGVSHSKRRERAIKVIQNVGLGDQIHQKPNQLSGGQMQRVAIARALINNPKVLLADEPTGALDSVTSDQIIQLIKDISKDRLVIMVTHNSEIASKFSDRVIHLFDGLVISDSNPPTCDEDPIIGEPQAMKSAKTSMPFYQAIFTSFKNLITKKGRTIITAIAGSIGIIGVAAVLGLSTGMSTYMDEMQKDSLSGFPITIGTTITSYIPDYSQYDTANSDFPSEDVIFAYDQSANTVSHINVLSDEFLSYLNDMDSTLVSSISTTSAMAMNIVIRNDAGSYQILNNSASSGFSISGSNAIFNELPNNQEFVLSQYDILAGSYPSNVNEVALVIDSNNRLSIEKLTAIGISVEEQYSFSDFLGMEFKVVPNDSFYSMDGEVYLPRTDIESMFNDPNSISVVVSCIIRVNKDATSELLPNGISYTHDLTTALLELNQGSEVVSAQNQSQDVDVLTGQAFNELVTYEDTMKKLGGTDVPSSIQIYPSSYQAKETIKEYINAFNVDKAEEDTIVYSDLAEVLSSTISSLISTITLVLTGFAGISLVVSSIMIGIITYVSVIERTKEIGIMRSLGARKKDISRIFNAESILIGFSSGAIGIVAFYLLQILINLSVGPLLGIEKISQLPSYLAIALIVLSCFLTLVSGLIPSRIAAGKDPVIALRAE